MNAREEAIFVVAQWLETKDFPERMIQEGPDRAFVTDLVYSTVRHYRTLLTYLEKVLSKKMPQGEVGAALLVGACQIMVMHTVKEHAAVFETVQAIKKSHASASGLVNGVLRNLIRRKARLQEELRKESIGKRFSHPDTLVKRWEKRFGIENTILLCEWDNRPATVFLAYPPGAPAPFVVLPRGKAVQEAEGYGEGAFIVEDPATAHAVRLLDVHPGMKVLDACSAPGGKTVQIAWRMDPVQGKNQSLIAVDLYRDRIQVVKENLERTRQEWVEVMQMDLADEIGRELVERAPFDRILIDAPCSNTGVMRRRPDARWRWTRQRMQDLVKTQGAILDHLAPLLAPDGKLVYSTCSLEEEENTLQIEAFLERHPGWKVVETKQAYPFKDGTDGAFACALMRR